ncbi:MAG: hypothetical protein L0220_33300, partial [Acidobacteria bacterium]|nr:hypothetical protein [Acidobacteriota bacterium]
MKWPLNQFAALLAPSPARPILNQKRRGLIVAAILMLLAVAILALYVKHQAQRQLDAARIELERSSLIPFEKQARRAIAHNGIKLIQNSKNVRDLAQFNNSYFAATDGGLVEFDPDGKLRRHYTVLDGLPESDLTCLAPFNSKLFIGTRSRGLAVFDGRYFEGYRWPNRNTQAITVLLEDRGRLLIGTFAGGLLEFDGSKFKEIKAGADRERLMGINCLVADGSRLYVGTFADGLWIKEAAGWSRYSATEGLLSNRVVGVAASGESLIIATDFGLSAASITHLANSGDSSAHKTFQTLLTLPSLSSLMSYRGSVLFSKDNGEIFHLIADGRSADRFQIVPLVWNRPENLSSCRL